MESPLIDVELADQFFGATNAEEIAGIREILRDFRQDIPQRFALLRPFCATDETRAAEARRGLHALRGVSANLALARSAATLKELETQWTALSPEERTQQLSTAEREIAAGLAALLARYPHLQ